MKKYWMLIFMPFLFSACLENDLEDLPEYEDADITAISRVEYRYYGNEINAIDGENKVAFLALEYSATVSSDEMTVSIEVTVPSSVSDNMRSQITTSNLIVWLTTSTAATVTPLEDAPFMGTPGDWSGSNQYLVTAANGTKKTWTITITDFTK